MEQDNSVINNARQGRHDALRELYDSTINYAWFVAQRYLKNDADISDVLQEAYISVFKNLHTFDEERSFNPWLYSIVSRKCLNFIKEKKASVLSYNEVESHMADTECIMPDEWLEREEKRREVLQIIDGLPDKQRMAYLRSEGAASQFAKLYELEAASAVVPAELSDAVWSVVIAADKGAIRHWFLTGVEQGYEHMLIVYDRMDYPDEPDSPYYYHSAEAVYEALSDFRQDPMCEVMECYDLTADMEEQLSERRAWRLPDLPDEEEEESEALPDIYPASGLLTSGETRLAFMQRKNAEYINGQYAQEFGELGARAIPLYVFTDDSKEFVREKCAYVLEQEYFTKATVGVVYCFNPDGTASDHSRMIMCADEEIEDSVLLPLPECHTVRFAWRYVKFNIRYAFGKDKNSPAYKNESVYRTFILTRENERLGASSTECSTYVDKEAQEYYELATEFRQDKERTPDNVAAMLYAAARRGHAEAMYEFAVHWATHENNERVAQDWYKMAAHLGHEAAVKRIK